MKHVKAFNSPSHGAQLSELFLPDPSFSGKTDLAALFSAPEFLPRTGEEWHMRKTEMSLIRVYHGAGQLSQAPGMNQRVRFSLGLFLAFYGPCVPSRASCSGGDIVHLPKRQQRGAGPGFSPLSLLTSRHRRLNFRSTGPSIGLQ